jgi:hypothetical protein
MGPAALVQPHAQPVQAGLGPGDGDIVGQRAPPALRRGVVGLLHHALAVAMARGAEVDPDAVVLGDPGKRRGQPPGRRRADRGHAVKPPAPRQPTQPADHPVQPVDQVRQILGLHQHPTPLPRARQRADQQVRLLSPAPAGGRVGQLQPVPLRLKPRWVLDHLVVAAGRRLAGLAVRPQPARPERARERRVRPRVAQLAHLVEQGRSPQMRVALQPQPAVVGERLEAVRLVAHPHSRGALPAQIGPDRLAVTPQMLGDRRDRPALPAQRMCLHVFLPQHPVGLLDSSPTRPEEPSSPGAQVGTFDEQDRGTYVITNS